MKKLWSRVPRQVKTGINLLLALILVLLIYVFLGSPAFSDEMEYRRIEQAHLVGPADYLGAEEFICSETTYKLTLAADDNSVILYNGNLLHRERTGALTVLTSNVAEELFSRHFVLPIVVFDQIPNAVRAELEFTIQTTEQVSVHWEDEVHKTGSDVYVDFHETYFLEANRNNPGYFFFTVSRAYEQSSLTSVAEYQALSWIASLSTGSTNSTQAFPVTVRLYDKDNTLVCQQELFIRSPAGLAHPEGDTQP